MLEPVGADQLFAAINGSTNSLESVANQALSNGIDLFQEKDYKTAEQEFRRAAGMAQFSANGPEAYKYLAMTYDRMDMPDKAVKTYEQAVERFINRDDLKIDLGNRYYGQQRYAEAEKLYAEAVRLNPSDSNNYALGQAHLQTGKLSHAEDIYRKIIRNSPEDHAGYYGLGQTLSKMERFGEALEAFEQAAARKDEYWDAYAEIGYAHADLQQMAEAQQMVDLLQEDAPALADALNRYMYKTDPPKISFAHSSSTFAYTLPPKTQVAALDSYLSAADSSKRFTMVFQFDKEMDRESVEKIYNWRIQRASGGPLPGSGYNYGLAAADSEVKLPAFPESVYWDAKNLTATLRFDISQNETTDALIHAGGVEFQFLGEDKFGNAMDRDKDQFSGFSGVY
ncbi:MAG: tetratricopeptide repeat protein [Desulfobacterales bacterium]